MSDLWPLLVVILALVSAAQTVAIFALARAVGLIQLNLGGEPGALLTDDGLELGAVPSPFALADARTGSAFVWQPGPARTLLVFLSATCSVCLDIAQDAPRLAAERRWSTRLMLVVQGSADQIGRLAQRAGNVPCLVDAEGAAQREYAVERTPFAFLVEGGRVTRKGVVNNVTHLESLLDPSAPPPRRRAFREVELVEEKVSAQTEGS